MFASTSTATHVNHKCLYNVLELQSNVSHSKKLQYGSSMRNRYDKSKIAKMRLVVITTPQRLPNEDLTIRKLFESGLQTLHVRKPSFSEFQYRQYIERIPPVFHDRLMVHSHHLLAEQYNLKGIHYTETTRPTKIRRPKTGVLISTSFHSLGQLNDNYGSLDYAFLSPVFDSISKSKYYSAGFDTEELRTTLEPLQLAVLALGGIDDNKVSKLHELGFKGAAILGAIWNSKDPINEFIKIQKECEKYT